jgi:hypothetical protein
MVEERGGVVLRWRRSEAGVEERGLIPGRRGGVLLPWQRSEVAAAAGEARPYARADSKSVHARIFPRTAPLFTHFGKIASRFTKLLEMIFYDFANFIRIAS